MRLFPDGQTSCSAPRASSFFCDGDFWHGRDLDQRVRRLERGHNAPYWVAEIRSNVARDQRHGGALARGGWLVLRFWESDITRDERATHQPWVQIQPFQGARRVGPSAPYRTV